MIKKISKIENLGQYESFASIKEFGMNNIIFGFNGAGKSTLSDMFYSMANVNQEELIINRTTLNRQGEDGLKNIHIEIENEDGNKLEFGENKWSNQPDNMVVFNSKYIVDHVFVSKQITGNMVPIIMGREGSTYMRQREQLAEENNSLLIGINNNIAKLMDAGIKIKDFSTNKLTQKTVIKKIEKVASISLYPLAEKNKVEERIKNSEKYTLEVAVIENALKLYEQIMNVTPFCVAKVKKQVAKVPKVTSKQIADFLSHSMSSTDIKWAVRGYLNQKEVDICPMCGQQLIDKKAKKFFVQLGKYISQNKDDKIKEFCEELNKLAYMLEVININDKIAIFTNIFEDLNRNGLLLSRDAARFQKGLSWSVQDTTIIRNLVKKIKKKSENPFIDIVLTLDENNTIKLLNNVIKNIIGMGEVLSSIRERIQKKNDKKFSADELGKLFELSYGPFRSCAEEIKLLTKQLINNHTKIDLLTDKINDCYNQARLNKVNEFLLKLNTHIKIEVKNNSYFIQLKDFKAKSYEESRETIFSEGEQRAVAFAYFLSEIDNLAAEEKIIVIDDPISSMDLSRKSILSHQIAEMMNDENNQLILMTHDIGFVERVVNYLDVKTACSLFELRSGKNDFYELSIADYLTDDKSIYKKFISAAEGSDKEIDRIIALMSLRPFVYVNQIEGDVFSSVVSRSTYFAHTLYSKNKRICFKKEEYDNSHLKDYIEFVNVLTETNFDKERIISDYNFEGFTYNSIKDLYLSIPLDSMANMRKKVMLMRPLIEACFFQFSQKDKFDPENIGKMYKNTINSNQADEMKHEMCLLLKELYDASKKYHHGADEGSLLGISWVNPNEVEYYDEIMQKVISLISDKNLIRSLSA